MTITRIFSLSLFAVCVLQLSAISRVAHAESSEILFIHTDHLGKPSSITNSNRDVVWRSSADPFGDQDVIEGSIELNHEFPGQYRDRESNISYNYQRYYDAGTGRYLRADPLERLADINGYSYVSNNPIRFIDPRGLVKWAGRLEFASAAVAVGGGIGRVFLESECIDGRRARVRLVLKGGLLSYGLPIAVVGTPVALDDHKRHIYPEGLTGRAQITSLGIAGIFGINVSSMRIGNALSTGSISPLFGYEAALSIFEGNSDFIRSIEWESCECSVERPF